MENNKQIPFYQKPKFKEGIFLVSLLIIPLINFLVFWVYVNIDTIMMTFQRYNILTGQVEWYGIERYKSMFESYILGKNGHIAEQNVFFNSFNAIGINIIIFPIAITAAYAFYKKIQHEKYFRVCFYLPSLISVVVLATMYRNMFHAEFGLIKLLCEKLFNYTPQWLGNESEVMWKLIYIFCIWCGLGSNVIMMSGAMLRIPADIGEYSQLEGVGFWREMVQIVVPLVMPTIGVFIINIFISVFSFYMHPMMIAQVTGVDHKFYTVGWLIFDSTVVGSETSAMQGATLGMLMTLFMLPIIIGVRIVVKKCTPDIQF